MALPKLSRPIQYKIETKERYNADELVRFIKSRLTSMRDHEKLYFLIELNKEIGPIEEYIKRRYIDGRQDELITH